MVLNMESRKALKHVSKPWTPSDCCFTRKWVPFPSTDRQTQATQPTRRGKMKLEGKRAISIWTLYQWSPHRRTCRMHALRHVPMSNKDLMVISRSFRVQHCRISSKKGLVPCVVLWFEQVQKSWTTPNSWESNPWSLFPLISLSQLHSNYQKEICGCSISDMFKPVKSMQWQTMDPGLRWRELQREQGS